MKHKLAKKSILDGSVEKEFDEVDPVYAKLRKLKTEKETTAVIVSPISGNSANITISREGTPDEKLGAIMLDPNVTSEQKDAHMANYLFERGKESSSFLMELFRSKGEHTKETRAFKAQMRFDFEQFVSSFTTWLDTMSESVTSVLGCSGLYSEVMTELRSGRSKGSFASLVQAKYLELADKGTVLSDEKLILLLMSIRFKDEADDIRESVRKITQMREQERGAGIYISKRGKVYDITDKDIADIVMEEHAEEVRKVETKEEQK